MTKKRKNLMLVINDEGKTSWKAIPEGPYEIRERPPVLWGKSQIGLPVLMAVGRDEDGVEYVYNSSVTEYEQMIKDGRATVSDAAKNILKHPLSKFRYHGEQKFGRLTPKDDKLLADTT